MKASEVHEVGQAGVQEGVVGAGLGRPLDQRVVRFAGGLVTITAHPNGTLEELRAPLELSRPGATRLVQRLAESGWVQRSGPGGRGGHRLTPTREGRELVDRIFAARRAALLELLDGLDDSERQSLSTLIEHALQARATDFVSKLRLCRLCERPACTRCPVASSR